MTVFSGNDILTMIKAGSLKIISEKGFDVKEQIRPASVDLHLGNDFKRLRRSRRLPFVRDLFDLASAQEQETIRRYQSVRLSKGEGLDLRPGEVVLCTTEEFVEVPRGICCQVTGRSTYARLGIEVQCTQDHIAPGHKQKIPLQLTNNAPFSIRIYPYVRICQLIFFTLSHESSMLYSEQQGAKYLHETEVRESRFFEDKEIVELRKARTEATKKKNENHTLGLILDFVGTLVGVAFSILGSYLRPEVGLMALVVVAILVVAALAVAIWAYRSRS